MDASSERMPLNVHIMGLAGSGKTTLARWIADTFDLSVHDLDWVAYDKRGERPLAEIEGRVNAITGVDGWVTEGAYQEGWIEPLLGCADYIVWLDIGLHRCLFRMVKRHVRAELSGTNQHPGWVRLLRFLNYTRKTSRLQRQRTRRLLAGYTDKVYRCRTSGDISAVKVALMRRQHR